MKTRLQQVLLVTVGAVAAIVCVILGLWQMQVFVDGGNRTIAERAAQAPVSLAENMDAHDITGDVFGKPVFAEGRYVPQLQFIIQDSEDQPRRVLAALELADGRVLPVVRGVVAEGAAVPPPPPGTVVQTGILLPGEGDVDAGPDALESVRLPLLAQKWPDHHLVPGFITLTADDAEAQGLEPAPVHLPEGEGSVRNSAYALQWWVFGAFALGLSLRIAHVTGRRAAVSAEAEAAASLDSPTHADHEGTSTS